ncbi:MAG: hypothetical protein SGJ27_06365 [Candidatus Melainabacteria bacterium]|nr:hypothetical protein [Candidatus Melainabacteria bacterium]
MIYSHTQVVPPRALVSVGTLATFGALLAPGKMKLVGGALVAGLMSTFRSLTVSVSEREIALRFGEWFQAKRIPLVSIKACAPRRMSPVNGWGIRFVGNGWLFNVYGLDAVEVELLDGSKTFIGTDQPQALCEAIMIALVQLEPSLH